MNFKNSKDHVVTYDYEKKQFTIDKSPFGDEGAVHNTMLGMVHHFRNQLISYRSLPKTPEKRAWLEADIKAYDLIIESGSEANARKFLQVKAEANVKGQSFKDNLAVIDHIKSIGAWQS